MLQNNHVIDPVKQICYPSDNINNIRLKYCIIVHLLLQVICRGPENSELLATFQSRNNPKYLSSLGLSIVEIAKRVPDGLLVCIISSSSFKLLFYFLFCLTTSGIFSVLCMDG